MSYYDRQGQGIAREPRLRLHLGSDACAYPPAWRRIRVVRTLAIRAQLCYNGRDLRGYSSVVERHLPKVNVRGSNPLTRSFCCLSAVSIPVVHSCCFPISVRRHWPAGPHTLFPDGVTTSSFPEHCAGAGSVAVGTTPASRRCSAPTPAGRCASSSHPTLLGVPTDRGVTYTPGSRSR